MYINTVCVDCYVVLTMDLQNHLKTSTAFKFETERFKTNLKYRNKGSAEH